MANRKSIDPQNFWHALYVQVQKGASCTTACFVYISIHTPTERERENISWARGFVVDWTLARGRRSPPFTGNPAAPLPYILSISLSPPFCSFRFARLLLAAAAAVAADLHC